MMLKYSEWTDDGLIRALAGERRMVNHERRKRAEIDASIKRGVNRILAIREELNKRGIE